MIDAGYFTVDGTTKDYPYTKTSFVPLPFQWPVK